MKLRKHKRVIIKIGTNTLTAATGTLDTTFMTGFVAQMASMAKSGYDVALVSSGAVRAGMSALGLERVRSLRESQAAAAVGQGILMHMYREQFSRFDVHVGQILLIADDFRDRTRYLNARNTLFTLFEKKIVPIINENDSISAEEIKFGDNDSLAVQLVGLIDAGILIFLSDVDGLHERNGRKLSKRIAEIPCVTPEIEALASRAKSQYSKGGMITKIRGAKIATEAGAHVYIANGREENVILRLMQGEDLGSHFLPQASWRDSRKRWIGMSSAVAGSVTVDDGAARVLIRSGRSLLAAGIIGVSGNFRAGDVVRILNKNNEELGRGLANYSAAEIDKIKGIHSRLIPQILGFRGDPEIIHRDNLFTYKGMSESKQDEY